VFVSPIRKAVVADRLSPITVITLSPTLMKNVSTPFQIPPLLISLPLVYESEVTPRLSHSYKRCDEQWQGWVPPYKQAKHSLVEPESPIVSRRFFTNGKKKAPKTKTLCADCGLLSTHLPPLSLVAGLFC